MRLWSLHPRYLDRMGLLGLWRETIVAKRVLLRTGVNPKIKGYFNHPQLDRFSAIKDNPSSLRARLNFAHYIFAVYQEGIKRGYNLNQDYLDLGCSNRIYTIPMTTSRQLKITTGQLVFELALLRYKVWNRDLKWFLANLADKLVVPEPNPAFRIVWGPRSDWEKSKLAIEWEWTPKIAEIDSVKRGENANIHIHSNR